MDNSKYSVRENLHALNSMSFTMNDSQKYQVAPNGGYNYYPQNLQKRVQMKTSYGVPHNKSKKSNICLFSLS